MKFARYTFAVAGIWGILVLVPMYLFEEKFGVDNPPAITHPEFYYGFIGVALAFQIVFLIIATDPVRYRAVMLASIAEKFSFGIVVLVLLATGRLTGSMVYAGLIDTVLGVLFIVGYFKTGFSKE